MFRNRIVGGKALHFVAREDRLSAPGGVFIRLPRLLLPRLASAEQEDRTLDALGAAQVEAMSSLGAAPPDTARARRLSAYLEGFSLHAAVHLHANDREGLARLCGYGARPPLSQDRLSELPRTSGTSAPTEPCAASPRLTEEDAPAVIEPSERPQNAGRRRRPADSSRIPWAELLLRLFRADVLTCPSAAASGSCSPTLPRLGR